MKKYCGSILLSMLIVANSLPLFAISSAQARIFDHRWYTSLPVCSEMKVLDNIVQRFNKADASLWHNEIALVSISGAYERDVNIAIQSSINRRYCRGKAWMSNGKSRTLHFVIEQGMGLAGFKWGVEYCLKGSDRWRAYNGGCRVLRR